MNINSVDKQNNKVAYAKQGSSKNDSIESNKDAFKSNTKVSSSVRYKPYKNRDVLVEKNDTQFKHNSQFIESPKQFSSTADEKFESYFKNDSEDIFNDDDEYFKDGLISSQSTPLNEKQSTSLKENFIKPAPLKSCVSYQNQITPIKRQHFEPVDNTFVVEKDPFNESLNISYFNLNEMHSKNLEKRVLNEDSKVNGLSQIGKTSQYKNEVLNSFNLCETTICHLNEDLFKDNEDDDKDEVAENIFDSNSLWENTMSDKNDLNNTFEKNLPNDLSRLLSGDIGSVGIHTTGDASLNKSLQILPKKKRSPLMPAHYSGDFYGLPSNAKSLVHQYKGIEKLYDWQNECLTLPAVMNRENLIYALPTSGGKTLVAEILMLREVTCRKKNVLFILPFVSIVQEKVWGLSPFAVGLDFLVEEYAAGKGIFPPRKRRKRKSIYIATLEKGLSFIRSLLENNRLDEIGLIVVDELHLLGEPTRGCTLEMLLTNVMYSGEDIQIVGMSATIGNIDEIAKFLDAEVFMKDFRPVDLKEYIKLDERIMRINWNAGDLNEKVVFDRRINYGYSPQVEKIDPDHLGGLVMEVIPTGSCLIFCPTKKNCENVASLLCKVIFRSLLEHRIDEKNALIQALKAEGGGEDILFSLLPWGVAYHHSGLSAEERRLIEDAFRSGVLNVLCCTSTLAAGVNLPAQRVILRAPLVGKAFISLSTYKQMVGRAGRAGYGSHGESILICSPQHVEKVKQLINSPMDKASSNLHANNGSNIRSLILGAIALELACTRRTLRKLINSTLLCVQAERLDVDIKQLLDKAIETLFKMNAIHTKKNTTHEKENESDILENICMTPHTRNSIEKISNKSISNNSNDKYITVSNDTELTVSRLGKAAIKGSIELQRAHMLYADLKVAQQSLVIIGVLHLLYLVTPYDLAENIRPNLNKYYSILSKMDSDGHQTAKVIGLTESTAIQMAKGKVPKSISERILNRFYVTLMLYDLWNQSSLYDVSEKFHVNRGIVQNLMLGASTFASSVLRFCEELEEFWAFRDLLKTFNQRLAHFCSHELIPLMELPSVKKSRAMQLYKAGYKSIQSIARAKPIDLIESLEHINKNVANQLIAAAKLLLLEKVENLRDEAEEVMIGLELKSQ